MKEIFPSPTNEKNEKTIDSTEPVNSEGSVESVESDEKINEELEKESEKFKDNFESLQNDINDFGGEEALTAALNKNTGIASRILGKVAIIAPCLMMANALLVGSIGSALHSGDYAGLAVTLLEIAAASGAIAAIQEYFTRKKPRTVKREARAHDLESRRSELNQNI